ncbi:MAG: YkgJ family cysteine cluster protein [Candidatus Omnitrophica bacterium]|nr:YkgJ family cysteine cluster protein [Candidatus Omnitrophota bacterium]
MIRQYTDSAMCLQCKGCCYFHSPAWAPRLLAPEKQQIGMEQMSGALIEDSGRLRCPFLQAASHRCRIYPARPLECALYPFLLSRRNDTLDLLAHRACAVVAETYDTAEFSLYAEYLETVLREPEILSVLQREYHLFVPYDDAELIAVRRDIFGAEQGARADGSISGRNE